MIAVRNTRGKAPKADRLVKAVADLERIERELARAQNRWQKQRALVKRLEAKADREWLEASTPRADLVPDFDDDI